MRSTVTALPTSDERFGGAGAGYRAAMAAPDPDELEPEAPQDEGLVPTEPDIIDVEPVHLLANEVRDDLRGAGFDDDQIDDWARAFFAGHTGGTREELLDWIATEQGVRLGP